MHTRAVVVRSHCRQHEIHELLCLLEEDVVPRQIVGAHKTTHHPDVGLKKRDTLQEGVTVLKKEGSPFLIPNQGRKSWGVHRR